MDRQRLAAASVALLGVGSVISLLAWMGGLGPFQTWFLFVSAPSLLILTMLGLWLARVHPESRLAIAIQVGAAGGLIGTLGYDVVRLPFVAAGLRLLAPIDSYGLLLTGADSSSGLTGLAGWGYHFANGIGFGVAYAAVALGRKWWWGLIWAMVLETATIVSPFIDLYGLRARPELIVLAYAAHVAYGVPLGRIVERAGSWRSARELPVPVSVMMAGLVLALLVWLRPWSVPSADRDGRALPGPSAVVRDGRFRPEWVRIPINGCATIRNDDDRAYLVSSGATGSPVSLEPRHLSKLCYATVGAKRVRLTDRPYSGGFVLVDPET